MFIFSLLTFKSTDYTRPRTWFTPRVTGEGAFKSAYDVMNNRVANRDAISYGHIADFLTLELFAKISLNAHLLGGAKEIPKEQIDKLLYLRDNYYHVTGKHPGYKHYNNQK